MRKLIYHVAMSIDYFIAGEDDNINDFPKEGDHVEEYVQSLLGYNTVIMGRRTYEFGYQYGMKPGESPYPHMKNYIVSTTLELPDKDEGIEIIKDNVLASVSTLKAQQGTDIYLCGGGSFAGYLLHHDMIDELHIKLNPILIGKGIKLFGAYKANKKMELISSKAYQSGVLLLKYGL